ncbi:MAG: type II secretion system protein [Patescibacteria group bacterium]
MKKAKFIIHNSLFKSSGYTLIELLVAMSVFVIITSIAIGGYVRGIKTSRQAAALAAANSNVASALEQMMRELRVGFGITSCPNGCIEFYNLPATSLSPLKKKITYRINGERIERGEDNNFNFIIDSNVKISKLVFEFPSLPVEYPTRVTIQIGIQTDEPGVEGGVINLQTTVSARN